MTKPDMSVRVQAARPRKIAHRGRSHAGVFDEQHAVGAGQARHQVMLIGPQVRLPVGEPDADDVAAVQGHAIGAGLGKS